MTIQTNTQGAVETAIYTTSRLHTMYILLHTGTPSRIFNIAPLRTSDQNLVLDNVRSTLSMAKSTVCSRVFCCWRCAWEQLSGVL